MYAVTISGNALQLLPQKAVYVERLKALLVSDVHLGKSDTFQALGVPIPNVVNEVTLDRLQKLCAQFDLDYLFILGDLFHSKFALTDDVLNRWFDFLKVVDASVQLIVGNHDRALVPQLEQLSISCILDAIQIDNLVLSHEPRPQPNGLNVCGHVHPCVRLKTKLDTLRLPCFYLENSQNLLILPAFGEFTGGYEMSLTESAIAYAVVEDAIIPFAGDQLRR